MTLYKFSNVLISGLSNAIPKNLKKANRVEHVLDKEAGEGDISSLGITKIHIAKEEQTTSDFGFVAANALIKNKEVSPEEIGLLVFVSNTPDYINPPSAAVLQYRLDLPKDCLAYDINMGGSAFPYGLKVACSLVQNMSAKYGLLVVGNTTSKLANENSSFPIIFDDGASAVLIEKTDQAKPINVISETYSEGFNSYILRNGGFRKSNAKTEENNISRMDLQINKEDFENFALSKIPNATKRFLEITQSKIDDYDIVAIHHDSVNIIQELIGKLGPSHNNAYSIIHKYGRTSNGSIPMLISDCCLNKSKNDNLRILAIGFGEGFSLGIASLYVSSDNVFPIIETNDYFAEGSVSKSI